MTQFHRILFSFAVILLPLITAAQDFPKAELEKIGVFAKDYVDLMNKEIPDSKEAELTDEKFRTSMPIASTRMFWEAAMTTAGKFQSIVSTKTYPFKSDEYISYCETQMESAGMIVTILHNKEGKVAGIFFAPPAGKPGPEASYANSSAYTEKEIIIRNPNWPLPASLTMPKGDGPFPAVVLVHGSGPNDRDATIGPNKIFRDLAHGLAAKGVAVLRYEKRTKFYAAGMSKKSDSITIKEEVVDDAVYALGVLAGLDGIDKNSVFVVGHSLGAICAPRIAKQSKNAAGIIMLAGTSRPMEDLILEQTKYIYGLDDSLTTKEKSDIAKLEKQAEMVKSIILNSQTPKKQLPLNLAPLYWLALRDYDVSQTIREMEKPALIVQGLRDYQVTKTDFDSLITQVGDVPNVSFKMFPMLDHLMISGSGKSKPSDYTNPGNVAVEVIDEISSWIKSQSN